MLSRRNSQVECLSARSQPKSLNIIDFILQQNRLERLEKNNTTVTITQQDDRSRLQCKECLPRLAEMQAELRNMISTERFQSVMEKTWAKIKRVEEENIRINNKIIVLEQIIEEQSHQINEFNEELQTRPTEQHEENQLQQLQKRLEKQITKDITKEITQQMKSIDANISKHTQQSKELSTKFIVTHEKHEQLSDEIRRFEEQMQMISHKFTLTREECIDRCNSITEIMKQNTEFLQVNSCGVHELRQQQEVIEADIMNIFKQVKGMLDLDFRVGENENTMQQIKQQLVQLKSAVNGIEQHKRSQESRAAYSLMNQNNHISTSNWFSPKHETEVQTAFKTSPIFDKFQVDPCIIHSKQASLVHWNQNSEAKMKMAKDLQSQIAKSKPRPLPHHFSVTGIPKLTSPSSCNSKGNQTTFLKPVPNRVDAKIKTQLSQKNKHNFLYFLLVQKVGTKDEKQCYEFLKKTYNFEPPQPEDQQNVKVTKKGIKYLFTREEGEEQINQQTRSIFEKEPRKKRQPKELPLDKYLEDMHETQLRRFPKIKGKLDALEIQD